MPQAGSHTRQNVRTFLVLLGALVVSAPLPFAIGIVSCPLLDGQLYP
jgi:hypothetical protein